MRKMFLVLTIGMLALNGCVFDRYIYVHDRYPILNKPDRPQIAKVTSEELAPLNDEVKAKIIKTVKDLKDYSEDLEIAVDEYNLYATEKNLEYKEEFDNE